MDIKPRIIEVISNLLKVKPQEIQDNVRLCDGLGVDSTEMVEMVITLEKAFGVKLSAKDITKFSTVNEIEKVIQSKISQ